ncbi:MAG TPA: phosphate regulon sensor histidine kinase PhoR [Rhodocyclaceae bacterium]|nr:phosphate regulon sensor histidine kinase PhoR [Rhodocyclaceae bacterium]
MSGNWLWIVLGVVFALMLAMVLRDRRYLRRLIRWASQPIGTPVPDAMGRWGDAFAALHKRSRIAAEQREQLHDALERFRQAAQAMPDGVAILGAKFAIEWLNGHAESLLGIDNGRDVGTPIVNLLREPEFIAYLQGGDYGQPRLLRPTRRQGQSLQVQAIPFSQGRIMLLVRDVTQIERLETMRRDFVANVSHELKTPLTVVSGFVETLADGWQDLPAEDVRHYLALSGDQAARMRRLIDDLLTLSALETDAPPTEEPVDMASLLAEVREEAAVLSGGHHEIAMIDTGPPILLGNPREIRSALGNLVSNAVRYTPAGGRIELCWRRTDDDGAAFAVTDTGIGIDPQHLPRLTERFYRVDRGRSRETGGTGLGLAIVKHVLERHGGHLNIESKPGQGSCFTALLPARRVAPTRPA